MLTFAFTIIYHIWTVFYQQKIIECHKKGRYTFRRKSCRQNKHRRILAMCRFDHVTVEHGVTA